MTPEVFERIRDDTMIHVRADSTISYDSRLVHLLVADELERLLTVVQDNIAVVPDDSDDTVEWVEEVDWGGVEDDCRKEGMIG